MVRVHFREPLCRGPRIDYRRNIYDRLYVIYRRSQKLRFRISKVDKLSSIFYRLLSKFLSLFFTDAGENRIYFCEQVYASRDNMSGSSSCERNRAFYEVSVSENEARYYICKGTARNFRVGRVKAPFESLFLPLPPYRPLYHDPVFLRIRDTKGRERRRWKIKGGRKKREGGKKKMRGKSASR